MLNPLQSTGPEQFFFDAHAGATYRPLDELSDSSEAEMEISEGEDNAGGAQEPSSKRARLGAHKSAVEDSVPKWSNPDPYTALPPPDAAAKPRKDVVQLIRKARVESKESKASIPAEAADFIACDFDDSDDDRGEFEVIDARPVRKEAASGVSVAPINSRSGNHHLPPLAPAKPSRPETIDLTQSGLANLISTSAQPTQQKTDPKAQPALGRSQDDALGSRKRTHDDEIKLPAHAKLKRVNKMPVRGALVYEWRLTKGEESCPWLVADHSTSTPGNW